MVDLVLRYQTHAKYVVFAVTSLSKQDIILGFTWLQEHNSEVDWAQSKVAMSWCPRRCSTCATEVKEEHQADAREYAAIWAYHADHLLFADLDLLDPALLAFPYREALYENDCSSGRALKEELEGEFHGIHHLEFPDEAVEVGDQIYVTTLHPPLPIEEIHASQTTSQQLAQVFATNSLPQAFWDVVP
ncbi:hypothetical protein C0993_003551, partial [Termitomyces sp. T159_Od127]